MCIIVLLLQAHLVEFIVGPIGLCLYKCLFITFNYVMNKPKPKKLKKIHNTNHIMNLLILKISCNILWCVLEDWSQIVGIPSFHDSIILLLCFHLSIYLFEHDCGLIFDHGFNSYLFYYSFGHQTCVHPSFHINNHHNVFHLVHVGAIHKIPCKWQT